MGRSCRARGHTCAAAPRSEVSLEVPGACARCRGADRPLDESDQRVRRSRDRRHAFAPLIAHRWRCGPRHVRGVLRCADTARAHPAPCAHATASRWTHRPAVLVRARALPGGPVRAPGAGAARDAASAEGGATGGGLCRRARRRRVRDRAALREGRRLASRVQHLRRAGPEARRKRWRRESNLQRGIWGQDSHSNARRPNQILFRGRYVPSPWSGAVETLRLMKAPSAGWSTSRYGARDLAYRSPGRANEEWR